MKISAAFGLENSKWSFSPRTKQVNGGGEAEKDRDLQTEGIKVRKLAFTYFPCIINRGHAYKILILRKKSMEIKGAGKPNEAQKN